MSELKVTIIGLGLTGVSLGLALKSQESNFEIVGHDKDNDRTSVAKRLNSVDRTIWNLYAAIEGADMVVLAVPFRELDELLSQIGNDLKSGCFVLCLTSVMQPALSTARQHLTDGVHFVVGHPIINGVGGELTERADLFDEAIFCLAPAVDTDPEAVELANNLISRVGATPLYLDAAEHDGLVTGVEHLPNLISAALMRSVAGSASWREARKLAGRPFAHSTEIVGSVAQLSGSLQANQENLLHWVRTLREELADWEQALGQESENSLEPLLAEAIRARDTWERDAFLKDWEGAPIPEAPEEPGLLRQMFMGNMFKPRRQQTDDE